MSWQPQPLTRRGAIGAAVCLAAGPVLAQVPLLPEAGTLRPRQFAWQPETAPSGPVLILVSLTEQVPRVYRSGIEIGQAAASCVRPDEPLLPAVFMLLDRPAQAASPVWTQVDLLDGSHSSQRSDALDRLTVRPALAAALQPNLVPGTSLYCALGLASPDTRTNGALTVVAARAS
jgi:hypothetical protein